MSDAIERELTDALAVFVMAAPGGYAATMERARGRLLRALDRYVANRIADPRDPQDDPVVRIDIAPNASLEGLQADRELAEARLACINDALRKRGF